MFILLKGKLKDFVPKTLDELEEDYQRKNPKRPTRIIFKQPSQESITTKNIKIPHKQAEEQIDEDSKSNISEDTNPTPRAADPLAPNQSTSTLTKKLSVIKGLLPFLKKETNTRSANDNLMNLRYKKLITKKRPSLRGSSIDMNDLEKQVDLPLMNEFIKKKNTYFVGNLLKVKFSCFMYPGDVFGILALKENSLRRRSIVAAANSKLIMINKSDFINVLEAEKHRLALKKKTFTTMFNKFTQGQTMLFSHLWTEEHYKLNDVIFEEGEKADHFYLIADGEVLVSSHIQV